MDLHAAVSPLRPHAYGPTAVSERVLDEVAERLLESHPVRLHRARRAVGENQRAPLALRAPAQAVAQGVEDVRDRHRFELQRQLPLVRAGDDQKGLRELRETVRFLNRGGDGRAELLARAAVPEGQLELGLVGRERRSQFVARVVHECALALERIV